MCVGDVLVEAFEDEVVRDGLGVDARVDAWEVLAGGALRRVEGQLEVGVVGWAG